MATGEETGFWKEVGAAVMSFFSNAFNRTDIGVGPDGKVYADYRAPSGNTGTGAGSNTMIIVIVIVSVVSFVGIVIAIVFSRNRR